MATYEEIYGKRVKEFDSDPTLDSSYEGQVWYDKSSGTLKSVVAISAWVSSTPLPIATNQSGGAGVNTASLIFGGTSPANNAEDATYEYNGSGYTNSGDLNTSRTGISGAGTQTAALGAGGYLFPGGSNHTETYNGTSWTAATAMPSANSYCSCGTQTAAIYVVSGTTLEYSSPSWTAGGGLNTPRSEASMAGTQTANIFFGGGPQTSASSASEEYDGTSFTNSATMNTARGIQIGGSGVQTSALAYGGAGPSEPGISTATESWNGTSWSTEGSLGTKASQMQKGGSTSADSTSGIAAGGFTPSRSSKTEEYAVSINTITAAAWANGGNMNTARRAMVGGAGTSTAGMVAGGYTTTNSNATEEYDGSAWANGGNLPVALYYITVAGTQTAGLAVGGGDPVVAEGIEYDGSSWTDIGNAPVSVKIAGRAGTQTAALLAGGNNTSNNSTAEAFTYDGSSFSNITDMPAVKGSGHVSGGSQTASVQATGYTTGSPGYTDTTVEWDGSSWSSGGTYLSPGQSQMCSNPSGYNQLAGGGYLASTSAITNITLGYNGTSWFTQPSISTARQQGSGFGTQTDGVFCAGTTGTATNATEEFTGETTAVTASTLTTS